jgi:hypothetical protein
LYLDDLVKKFKQRSDNIPLQIQQQPAKPPLIQ